MRENANLLANIFLTAYEYQIIPVGVDGEGISQCLVQSALPPFCGGITLPFQSFG
jgi:hypothetical protein